MKFFSPQPFWIYSIYILFIYILNNEKGFQVERRQRICDFNLITFEDTVYIFLHQ